MPVSSLLTQLSPGPFPPAVRVFGGSWGPCPQPGRIRYAWGVARPWFPRDGPAYMNPRRSEALARAQVQDDDLVSTRASPGVGARGLPGLVGVLLGRPADEVLRVVLEPLRRRGERDHRQVGGDELLDRSQVSGLLLDGRIADQLRQCSVYRRVLEPLVVASVGLAVVERAVQPVVVQVVWRQAVVGPVLGEGEVAIGHVSVPRVHSDALEVGVDASRL